MRALLNYIQFRTGHSSRILGVLLMGLLGGLSAVQAQVQTEMRVFNDSFISPSFEATQKTNYQFVGAQVKSNATSDDSFKMNVSGGLALGAPLMNYLNISEFYFEAKQEGDHAFVIGRKRMLWSELDARWDLGVWEPVFEWNPLSPERQGLTGLFYQVDRPSFSILLFASPFFIPDQGPSFEIEDGEFKKGNPWFRRPPESIRIFQEATKIEYNLQTPDQAKIVFQNSYGMKLSFGDPQGFKTQLAYTYKPANQLAIGFDGGLSVGDPEPKGIVDLQPQVFYHSLMGADLTYRINRVRFGISGLYDRPSQDQIFESKWSHSVYEDAVLVSPFVEWSNGPWGLSLQHLQVQGGKATEVGGMVDQLPKSNRMPLSIRYPYQEAQQLSLITNFGFGKDRRLVSKVSYMHSSRNQFDLIRFSARFRMSALWSFLGEMQLLSAEPANAENQNEIYQYVNNDRLMLGVAYAF